MTLSRNTPHRICLRYLSQKSQKSPLSSLFSLHQHDTNTYTSSRIIASHHQNMRSFHCCSGHSTKDHHHHENEEHPQVHVKSTSGSQEGQGVPIAQVQPTLAMIYTCLKCETRSAQQFARVSYEKGTVVVRCPGCQALHLVADNMGIFTDEKSNIFDYLKEKGTDVEESIKKPEELERILQGEGVEIGQALGVVPKEEQQQQQETASQEAEVENPSTQESAAPEALRESPNSRETV